MHASRSLINQYRRAAVYAYAREDYDWWQAQLDRVLPSGIFGENLTIVDVDVNGAMIGETWRIGDSLVLQATFGRIPCVTFQAKMAEPHWVRTFTRENRRGAYLRVVEPGDVQAGTRRISRLRDLLRALAADRVEFLVTPDPHVPARPTLPTLPMLRVRSAAFLDLLTQLAQDGIIR